jgi:hypothetical protein
MISVTLPIVVMTVSRLVMVVVITSDPAVGVTWLDSDACEV